MARMRISQLRGMTPELAESLRRMGIRDSDALLERAAKAGPRRELARELGVDASQLLELVNRADLARLRGIGAQYSNLLEEAGVDSVKELARRRADNLQQRMAEVAMMGGHAKRPPRMREVESWIEQAKRMGQTVQD